MIRHLTIGQKIGAGFSLTVALTLVIAAVSILALRTVTASKDQVIAVQALQIIDAGQLATESSRCVAAVRAIFLSNEGKHTEEFEERKETFKDIFWELRQDVRDAEGKRLLDEIEARELEYNEVVARLLLLRRGGATMEAVSSEFDNMVVPKHEEMEAAIDAFSLHAERNLVLEKEKASATAAAAINLVIAIGVGVVVSALLIAVLITRRLGKQIGTAVSQVQSSSTELQTAANQQASGAKRHATAMGEITTTLSELLATSRQIADSARHVSQIAGQTAVSAQSADITMAAGHESIAGISRQVELIVGHMLELGKKSQQIGAVLDIVSELAEQTNILAINATIEAAGAGEHGVRFSVVAEEIRKLADRVGGSTKEIRSLIEDVRSAVNTTVMATESGAKAVDAGSKQFGDVASAFKQIGDLVSTTTDAAKEIELSTKQQATAVEQVNTAITNLTQATREGEVSATQTLQTANQLAGLSGELLRMVKHKRV